MPPHQRSAMLFICGLITATLWPILLYVADDRLLVAKGPGELLGLVFVAYINSSLFYGLATTLSAPRWLRAMVAAGCATAAVIVEVDMIQRSQLLPGLFDMMPNVAGSLSTFFVAIFAGSVITDKIFGEGRPLTHHGRSIVYAGVLSAMLYPFVLELLWGANIIFVLQGDHLMIAMLALGIALAAMVSFALAPSIVAFAHMSQMFVEPVTMFLAALLSAVVFYLEWISAMRILSLPSFSSFKSLVIVGVPVLLATFAAYCVVWFLVRAPASSTNQPPRRDGTNVRKNRKKPPPRPPR